MDILLLMWSLLLTRAMDHLHVPIGHLSVFFSVVPIQVSHSVVGTRSSCNWVSSEVYSRESLTSRPLESPLAPAPTAIGTHSLCIYAQDLRPCSVNFFAWQTFCLSYLEEAAVCALIQRWGLYCQATSSGQIFQALKAKDKEQILTWSGGKWQLHPEEQQPNYGLASYQKTQAREQ